MKGKTMTNKKIRKQLKEVKQQIQDNKLSLSEMSNLFRLRNELEFKLKKQNIIS